MSGHVNMMDDVLISQLPPSLLRSALRALVSQGSVVQKTFVEHVRSRLRESPPPFTPAEELFATQDNSAAYLASVRCLFSSKMVQEAFPYFVHFIRSISQTNLRWVIDDGQERILEKSCGDIVQAVQALKESRPPRTPELLQLVVDLRCSLQDCATYCRTSGLVYPFTRASLQITDVIQFLFPSHELFSDFDSQESSELAAVTIIDAAVSEKLEYIKLGLRLRVPRLFNGLWQMSSPAWGAASSQKQHVALGKLIRAGLVATDMADHYGDAELIYGSFRNRLAEEVRTQVVAATKWCVFRPLECPVTNQLVLKAVMERARRVGGRVELLQFHWYDPGDKDYLLILGELVGITKTHPHLVSAIGLCNFDSEHMEEACQYLIARTGHVGIVSNQVQYSLIDSRPKIRMAAVCQKYGVHLLTYGSFCGGFLSEKWLGAKSPDVYAEAVGLTPSQRKYFDMIMTWGSWSDFQLLLETLKEIADGYGVELSNVATRWVLDNPEVGAVIVGTRLGLSSNIESNAKVFSFHLTPDEMKRIEDVSLREHLEGLYDKVGDCGHEYRNM